MKLGFRRCFAVADALLAISLTTTQVCTGRRVPQLVCCGQRRTGLMAAGLQLAQVAQPGQLCQHLLHQRLTYAELARQGQARWLFPLVEFVS